MAWPEFGGEEGGQGTLPVFLVVCVRWFGTGFGQGFRRRLRCSVETVWLMDRGGGIVELGRLWTGVKELPA